MRQEGIVKSKENIPLRLKDPITKSGFFWQPKNPDKKLPGILSISDGGNIELEIVGFFDDSIEGLNRFLNNVNDIDRLVGHIEEFGYVTLDGCYYKNRNYAFGGISKSIIKSKQAIMRVAYDPDEPITLNTFMFSIEGIDEWVGLSGINVFNNFELKISEIKFIPPENIVIKIDNGMELVITFSWSVPFFSNLSEAKIAQKTHFKLFSKEERPQEDFISIAYKITTFLCFAIDKTVCITSASGTVNTLLQKVGENESRPLSFEIYYSSLPYVKKVPKIEIHQMLFRYPHIQVDAEKIINKWLNAYDIINPSLNLYFSTKAGGHKYLESIFLALIQALETYHRRTSKEKLMEETEFLDLLKMLHEKCPEEKWDWLNSRLKHGNEISLSMRIKRIIEPYKIYFGSSRDRNKLIRSIVNTRNYLTHYDESLELEAAKGMNLWILCQNIEAIFQLHLLFIIGFSNEEISFVYNNSQNLKNKIKII